MDGRKSGRSRRHRVRQPQAQGENQKSATGQNRGQRHEGDNQAATAINRMTDILEQLAEHQVLVHVTQPGAQERGEDSGLERVLKFAPT